MCWWCSEVTRPGPIRVGIVIAALYVMVAAATVQLSGRHVRPLYDGAGPATPYRWVAPPPEFAVTNAPPKAIEALVSVGEAGSTVTAAGTSDMQALVNLPPGAIPTRAGEDTAAIRITAVDPARLEALPDGRAANGNAYRIQVEYDRSRHPVDVLATEGSIVLTIPHPEQAGMVTSVDGRTWTTLDAASVGAPTLIGAAFTGSGYYLATTDPSHLASPADAGTGGGSGNGTGVVVVAVGTVVLVVALWVLPVALRRRNRNTGL